MVPVDDGRRELLRQFGLTGDMPLAQDTNGDGVAELNVWRPAGGAWFTYNRVTGATASLGLGSVGRHSRHAAAASAVGAGG